MRELARRVLAGEDAWVVGGAVRDRLLGRKVLDLDIVCHEPKSAAFRFAREGEGSPFALSEQHGAWRVSLADGCTADFTRLRGTITDDLALRDFTVNAIAEPLAEGGTVDPYDGRRDLDAGRLRAVSAQIFDDDPLRLLRAVRLEQELGLRLDAESEELVRRNAGRVAAPSGERILAELERLDWRGFERLDDLGLLEPLGGSLALAERVDRALVDSSRLRLATVLGERLRALPISGELDRYLGVLLRAQPPDDDSPRQIHRFRRLSEPWALDALAFLGRGEYAEVVRIARENEPDEPLLRGDELGIAPGPLVGELLELIAEERAAGTISTREEALALVRSRRGAQEL